MVQIAHGSGEHDHIPNSETALQNQFLHRCGQRG
jgi:hypothetical protein